MGADDVIDLGGKTLHFLPMPMVHWPDSMFTFCPESCTLMPNDAFGQHLATSERFADEIDLDLAIEELDHLLRQHPHAALRAGRQGGRQGRRAGLGLRRHRAVARRDLASRAACPRPSTPTTA